MIKKILFPLLAAFLLFACKNNEKADAGSANLDADSSYAVGMFMAAQFTMPGTRFDYDALLQGYRDVAESKTTKFTMDEAFLKVQAAYNTAMEKEGEKYRPLETEFLAENGKKQGIVVTSSGLQYEVISEGSGGRPSADDLIQVNYEGSLIDGTVFDSSYSRGEPAEFVLGNMIPGWIEGLQLMSEGGTYRFFIPSDLAYGARGSGDVIPPYSVLIFKVELLSILK
jgi:FKBP-type peptidyl-prolyl cis-trans isomerase